MRWPCLDRFNVSAPSANEIITAFASSRKFSQMGEDTLLHRNFFSSSEWNCRNKSAGKRCHPHPPTYLELGANNGVAMSNTFFFEQTLGWQGLLIEGVPNHCDRLVHSRCPKQAGNVIACGAVCKAEHGGAVDYFDMDAMSGAVQMGTPEQHLRAWSKHQPHNPKWGQKIRVPCAPLSAIASRAGLRNRRVDLFSLDVEGSEFQVLSTIDANTFRFGLLVIEIPCWNNHENPVEHRRTRALLSDQGYAYITRHKMVEFWGDLRLDWVRRGATTLIRDPGRRDDVKCPPHPNRGRARLHLYYSSEDGRTLGRPAARLGPPWRYNTHSRSR